MVIEELRAEAVKRNEKFLAERSIWERDMYKYIDGLKNVDKKYLDEAHVTPEDFDPHKLLPSVYAEPFNYDDYKKDCEKASQLFGRILVIRDRLVKKAEDELKCLT